MAGSLGDLVVRLKLDAADYTSDLVKAGANAERFAGTTTTALERTNREIKKTADVTEYLSGAFRKIAAGVGIVEIAKLNDEFSNVSARLKIVTADAEDFQRVQGILFKTANDTRASFGATANLFYRLSASTVDLGASQSELLSITDKLNKALVISGATGSTAKGALEQLSQALGANQLRGQEFNTVNEQGNRIIQALADGLHKTVKELREMANNGEITTEVFIRGFLKGSEKLDEEFKRIPVTISGAMQVAENELQRFVGVTAQASGGSGALATAIVFLAKHIDLLAAAAIGYGTIKLANIFVESATAAGIKAAAILKTTVATKAAAGVELELVKAEVARLASTEAVIVAARTQAITELQLAQAQVARGAVDKAFTTAAIANLAALGAAQAGVTASMVKSQAALAAAEAASAAGTGILGRALGLLGGPIGAITTVLGLGVAAWQLWSSTSQNAGNEAAASTEQSTQSIIANLDKQIAKFNERNRVREEGQDERQLNADALIRARELEKRALVNNKIVTTTKTTDFSGIAGGELGFGGTFDSLERSSEKVEDLLAEAKELRSKVKITADNVEFDIGKVRSGAMDKLREKFKDEVEGLKQDVAFAAKELKLPPDTRLDQLPTEIQRLIIEKNKKKTKADDPTKKEIDGQLHAIEAQIAKEKDILRSQEDFLHDTYAEGFLSVKNYYDGVTGVREDYLRRTLAFYDQEITVAEGLKNRKGAKKTEIADADNKIAAIREKQANAERDASLAQLQLDRDRVKSSREYGETLDELNAKILDMNGNTAAAAAIRFDAANRVAKNLFASTGDTAAIAKVAALRAQDQIQNQLNDSSKKYNVVLGFLSLEQEKLNNLRDVGALGEIGHAVEASAANLKYLEIMKQLAAQYDAIAEKSKDPADILKAKQMQQAVEQLSRQTDLLADKFNNILGDAFADNITALVTGAKSLRDAVKDFGKQINDQIVKMIADEFKSKLFGQGGFLSGAGGALSKLFGGGKDKEGFTTPGEFGGGTPDNAISGIGAVFAKLGVKTGADAAGQLASTTALTTSATALATSATTIATAGTTLTLAGTELSVGTGSLTLASTELTLSATSLLAAGTALSAAAAALAAASAADAAGGIAKGLGGITSAFTGPQFGTYAGGTDFAPGGMALVGEHGPELVDLPMGSRVIPNHKMKGMGKMGDMIVNQYINVPPGADHSSIKQTTLVAASKLQREWRNR